MDCTVVVQHAIAGLRPFTDALNASTAETFLRELLDSGVHDCLASSVGRTAHCTLPKRIGCRARRGRSLTLSQGSSCLLQCK